MLSGRSNLENTRYSTLAWLERTPVKDFVVYIPKRPTTSGLYNEHPYNCRIKDISDNRLILKPQKK